jgi:hypothetical protein
VREGRLSAAKEKRKKVRSEKEEERKKKMGKKKKIPPKSVGFLFSICVQVQVWKSRRTSVSFGWVVHLHWSDA